MRRFDLRSLHFDERDDAWRRLPVEVDPFTFGGLEYTVQDGLVDLDLSAGRVGDRITLTGSFEATLVGPCQRCLEEARVPVRARATEVALHGRSEGVEQDEAYVVGNVLAVDRWVRDAIAASLPDKLLCREDCRGLCPVCGIDLNRAAPHHSHG
jgi:uncharacterized protein